MTLRVKLSRLTPFTDFVDMTRALNKLARANGLSEDVEELLEKKAKAITRVGDIGLLHTERPLSRKAVHIGCFAYRQT